MLYDPVNPMLCKNLRSASSLYREELLSRKKLTEEKQKAFSIKTVEQRTEKTEFMIAAKLSKKSRQDHVKRLKRLISKVQETFQQAIIVHLSTVIGSIRCGTGNLGSSLL